MTTATLDRHRPTITQPLTGPYARVPHCDEHTDYLAGCTKCRQYQAWTARRHRRSVELGQPLSHDIDQVRNHLRTLQRAGMLLHQISRVADVNRSTINGILYQANRQFVCRDNALRILAVPVPATKRTAPTSNLIPAVGTIRRVQALARLGWTFANIIAAGGAAIHRLDQVKGQEWVTERFAAAVKTAYEALSMQRGPSVYTAARATKKGWPPPLAWDDDTIDDPDAKPVDMTADDEQTDTYDPTTVALAVDGRLTYDQIKAHRPDLIETVRRLAKSMSDADIAHHLRWPRASNGPTGKTAGQGAVCKLRGREGIPGPEKYQAVYAYRPGGRRSRAKAA